MERKQTIRQEIILLLEDSRLSVRDLSQMAGVMEKDVVHHLAFVEKSLKPLKKRLCMMPCYCMACGFEFKHRKRFTKPGKCPACRQGRIVSALYWIEKIS